MENHEFDQALRDFVTAAKLPYAPLQWERMAERLDAHGDSPNPIVRQQIIPFLPWTMSTAAACLLFTTVWLMSKFQSELPVANHYTVEQRTAPVAPPEVEAETAIGLTPPQRTIPSSVSNIPARKAPVSAQAPLAAALEIEPRSQSVASDSTPYSQNVTVEKPQTVAKVNPFILHPDLPEEEPRPEGRKTAFGVHGGYNIGEYKNNFTVGVNIKQKLGKRLNRETGIAVVSGPTETFREGGSFATAGANPSFTRTSEVATTNLTYLQAAPSLNYRIYRGLSAGGGVDAQRLLSKNPQTVTLNSFGDTEESDAQAEWDFGLTARMDVQVVKKLRAGMMYRESVHRISKGPQNLAGRNYLLLQLSYTIY